MKKLLAVIPLYLVAYAAVCFFWLKLSTDSAERGQHAIELGETQAAQLQSPRDNDLLLREACKGKLEPGSSRSIAAYLAKTNVKPSDDNDYDEVVLGVQEIFRPELVRERPGRFKAPDWKRALEHNASPADWKRHLAQARAGSPELGETRYLLVAKYFSMKPPQNEGDDAYTRARGSYAARVVTFPEGEVLCEGRGEVRMKETVNASGRGATQEMAKAEAQSNAAKLVPFVFSYSVTTSPLHEVCDVGGDALCKLTGEWVGSK